jgi:nucleotide-binding universal stress UspA family protein
VSGVRAGPVVIAYDGSADAEDALREAAELVTPRRALVVVVAKTGVGFDAVESPSASRHLPPATLDIRTAADFDQELYERARRLAERGAAVARQAGLEAEGLAVADAVDVSVAETLVDVARERDAPAMVVGAHAHGGFLGPITREVVRRAPCPVFVRGPAESRTAV